LLDLSLKKTPSSFSADGGSLSILTEEIERSEESTIIERRAVKSPDEWEAVIICN
jgi:hypothetical protein